MNLILTTLLLLAPAVVPESARFTIYVDGKKIGAEEFTITARKGGYIAEGKTQLAEDPMPITSLMELDEQLNPTSYEYKRGAGEIRVKIAKPLSEYATGADGQQSTTDFRFPEGGFIVDNNFFHHYVLLLYKLSSGAKTVPIFVPQDMRVGQDTIQSKGAGLFQLEIGDVKLEATTDARGRLIRLSVPDAKVVVER